MYLQFNSSLPESFSQAFGQDDKWEMINALHLFHYIFCFDRTGARARMARSDCKCELEIGGIIL